MNQLLCITALLISQTQETSKPTTSDSVGWALSDLAQVPAADRQWQRFIWIPPWGDEKWIAAVNFTVNSAVSHASVIQLGTASANGWLLRYDLRRLVKSEAQLIRLINVWDSLALQDPYFHVTDVALGIPTNKKQQPQIPRAVIAPHLKQREAVALAGLSISTGAVYRADFFIFKALSTLEGGVYYDFLQVDRKPTSPNKNSPPLNPQANWLSTLGVFEDTTKSISADQRSAIFRSNVTGKPRRIDVFYGLGRGGNLVTITHDIADEDIEAGQHPIRNLLAFDDRAREVIVERPNGTHAFALFDDNGIFQDSVPDNVATDHLIPAPHTKRLQPAIGCIRCHGPHDGYQPFSNDVQTILRSRLDVFSDLALAAKVSREQIIDQLAGLYAGQLDLPDAPIGRGRRDYSATVYKITGETYPAETSPVLAVSAHVSDIYNSYRYLPVTPQQAAIELGIKSLDELQTDLNSPIDPIEGTLRAGISVNRSDFEHAFTDLSIKALKSQEKKE